MQVCKIRFTPTLKQKRRKVAVALKHFYCVFAVTLKQKFYLCTVNLKKRIAIFQREVLEYLKKWATKPKRKPLILRGARQVGKTTLVDEFSKQFDT